MVSASVAFVTLTLHLPSAGFLALGYLFYYLLFIYLLYILLYRAAALQPFCLSSTTLAAFNGPCVKLGLVCILINFGDLCF